MLWSVVECCGFFGVLWSVVECCGMLWNIAECGVIIVMLSNFKMSKIT